MDINEDLDNFQKSEVSKIEWKNYNECIKQIRPYNLEKMDTLKRVDNILKSYSFF